MNLSTKVSREAAAPKAFTFFCNGGDYKPNPYYIGYGCNGIAQPTERTDEQGRPISKCDVCGREYVMAEAPDRDPDHLNPAEGGNRASDDYWTGE